MFKEIKLHVYEIFGYLIPGAVMLVGLFVLGWALFRSTFAPGVLSISGDYWVIGIFAAYLVGHSAQAIGNLVFNLTESIEDKCLKQGHNVTIPGDIVHAARSKIHKEYNIDSTKLESYWFFRLCDATVAQQGETVDREIWVYREGLYRGLAISFTFLALALIVRAFVPGTAIKTFYELHPIATRELLFLAILCFASAYFALFRFWRFASYRVSSAFVHYLAIRASDKTQPRKEEGNR